MSRFLWRIATTVWLLAAILLISGTAPRTVPFQQLPPLDVTVTTTVTP